MQTQVLFNWARFEWGLRLYGPARHLFRRAADLALAHPEGWAAGGAGIILHAWASAELQNDNVRNARIIAAKALRKCAADQPLYVLAGNIELAGGNLGGSACLGRRGRRSTGWLLVTRAALPMWVHQPLHVLAGNMELAGGNLDVFSSDLHRGPPRGCVGV